MSAPYRWTEPGALDRAACPLCGAECAITRDVVGPTGFAAALGGVATRHDRVACPHDDAPWHEQARELRRLAGETPSEALRAVYEGEAAALIASRSG